MKRFLLKKLLLLGLVKEGLVLIEFKSNCLRGVEELNLEKKLVKCFGGFTLLMQR